MVAPEGNDATVAELPLPLLGVTLREVTLAPVPRFVIGIPAAEIAAPIPSAFWCTFAVNVTVFVEPIKLSSGLSLISDVSNEYPVYTFPSVVASLTPPEYIVSVVPGIDGEIRHPISSYTMMLLRVRGMADVERLGRM
jgi:hypothetical protein